MRARATVTVALGAGALLAAPAPLRGQALEPRPPPQDSVEERQLHEVTSILRSLIRAQEVVYARRGRFGAEVDALPGIELRDPVRVRLRPVDDGYDLRVEREAYNFACLFERRLRLTPEDPPHLGRIRCLRTAPYEPADTVPSPRPGAAPR